MARGSLRSEAIVRLSRLRRWFAHSAVICYDESDDAHRVDWVHDTYAQRLFRHLPARSAMLAEVGDSFDGDRVEPQFRTGLAMVQGAAWQSSVASMLT
jgi:hypothetical protein